MSTCPDKDLYSAYIDGELQSPWKEKIVSHLKSCEKCKNIVDSYKKISLRISASSLPELDLDGSFLKLYAKRKDCLERMETNKRRPASWLYKSNKIPIPALVAAAVLLFVCTPIVMISTKKSLPPSEDIASHKFKTVDTIVNDFKTVNKFKFNISNIFVSTEKEIVFEDKNKEINLSQYVNLYLPPSQKSDIDDILKQQIKMDTLLLKDKKLTPAAFVKNGK